MDIISGEMFEPPTDNLYKVIAIFGLLIWGFSIVYPWSRTLEHEREEEKLEGETRWAYIEKDFIKAQTDTHYAMKILRAQARAARRYDRTVSRWPLRVFFIVAGPYRRLVLTHHSLLVTSADSSLITHYF
jgi:hypothetical protein